MANGSTILQQTHRNRTRVPCRLYAFRRTRFRTSHSLMKRIPIIALCLCLAVATPIAFTGCGTTNLLTTSATPNEQVVINAEKTLSTSKDTLTFFLQQEYQNKAFVKAHLPQVHQFAEYLRGQVSCGPKTTARFTCWLITANDLKNQYKHGNGNLQGLMSALDTLTKNVTTAQNYLTQIRQP